MSYNIRDEKLNNRRLTKMTVMNKKEGHLSNYISYFQSVMTVGIITSAISLDDAVIKANNKFNKSDLTFGMVSQSSFEMSETELWNPEFTGSYLPADGKMSFQINEKTKQKIAQKLKKSIDELTNDDCVDFVKGSIELSLS
jgi:hypothetical protein